MRIPRKTIYIKAVALINSNAFIIGDLLHCVKKADGWHVTNGRTGETYQTFISTLRNDNIIQIKYMV